MKSDLKNYVPENIEFVLEEVAKDIFPLELDFLSLKEEKLVRILQFVKADSKKTTLLLK